MNRRLVRSLLAVIVLTATAIAAFLFLRSNPDVVRQLISTPLETLLLVLFLYLVFMFSLWLVFRASLTLCDANLPKQETMLVSAYSSIINFFGPLQSGPAFRALYLKKRHNVSLRKYTLASMVYYVLYAFYSGLLLLTGVFGWGVLLVAALSIGLFVAISKLPFAQLRQLRELKTAGYIQTAAATAIQVLVFVIIFYVELNAFNPAITLQQAMIYTGAANFALFVSITPGAIGFRESFVLVTEKLHQLPETTVVAASLLDRGVYVVMLLILGLFIFGTQARAVIGRLSR